MKTIGETLKQARLAKRLSIAKVEKKTKIKSEFIRSIESQDWESLPNFSTVSGFVKSIAGTVGVKEKTAAAILKRDYPPKKVFVNPKPDVSKEFKWSPKLTFAVGALLILISAAAYLTFQYSRFTKPPVLKAIKPEENQVVSGDKVVVVGETNVGASIIINNQPVIVEEDGSFTAEIEVLNGEQELKVTATSRSGKKTELTRKIVVEF